MKALKIFQRKEIHGGVFFSINFLILIVVLKRITFISNGLELDEKKKQQKKTHTEEKRFPSLLPTNLRLPWLWSFAISFVNCL